jgi:hypothetical protein
MLLCCSVSVCVLGQLQEPQTESCSETSRIYKFICDISDQETVHVRRRPLSANRLQNPIASWITNTNHFDTWMMPGRTVGLQIAWNVENSDVPISTSTIIATTDEMLQASTRHQRLHFASIDLRNFARFEDRPARSAVPNQPAQEDRNDSEQYRRATNPKELMVVYFCLVLCSVLAREKILQYISELHEPFPLILESIASHYATSKESRADYRDLLKDCSEKDLYSLFKHATDLLSPDTLLILSLHNAEMILDTSISDIFIGFTELSTRTKRTSLRVVCHSSCASVIQHPEPNSDWLVVDHQTEYMGKSQD